MKIEYIEIWLGLDLVFKSANGAAPLLPGISIIRFSLVINLVLAYKIFYTKERKSFGNEFRFYENLCALVIKCFGL